jgi:hypothetical protein
MPASRGRDGCTGPAVVRPAHGTAFSCSVHRPRARQRARWTPSPSRAQPQPSPYGWRWARKSNANLQRDGLPPGDRVTQDGLRSAESRSSPRSRSQETAKLRTQGDRISTSRRGAGRWSRCNRKDQRGRQHRPPAGGPTRVRGFDVTLDKLTPWPCASRRPPVRARTLRHSSATRGARRCQAVLRVQWDHLSSRSPDLRGAQSTDLIE